MPKGLVPNLNLLRKTSFGLFFYISPPYPHHRSRQQRVFSPEPSFQCTSGVSRSSKLISALRNSESSDIPLCNRFIVLPKVGATRNRLGYVIRLYKRQERQNVDFGKMKKFLWHIWVGNSWNILYIHDFTTSYHALFFSFVAISGGNAQAASGPLKPWP